MLVKEPAAVVVVVIADVAAAAVVADVAVVAVVAAFKHNLNPIHTQKIEKLSSVTAFLAPRTVARLVF